MAAVEARLGRLRAAANALAPAELAAHRRAADALVAELEAGRELTRVWLAVDMDAFFAAVEQRDNPALAGEGGGGSGGGGGGGAVAAAGGAGAAPLTHDALTPRAALCGGGQGHDLHGQL